MKIDWKYFGDRLKEISTWRMLSAIAAGFGVAVTTGQVAAAFAAYSAGVALYEAFRPEAPKA